MHETELGTTVLGGHSNTLGMVQGMDDTEVAAMGYAELNEGISPTSALEVCAQPAATSQCPTLGVLSCPCPTSVPPAAWPRMSVPCWWSLHGV